MFIHASNCDPNRLRLLISNDLDANSQRETEEHLGDCKRCQATVLSLAGGRRWWAEASQFLTRDAHDPANDDPQFAHSTLWDQPATDSNTPSTEFVVSQLPPSDNPAMLGRLGQYEILEVIGHGGMGVVLKGYDGELNRFVAVKVLAPHLAVSGAARKRFAREAQAAAAIVHPNVLAIHSVESQSNPPYLVMPLVAGQTLQERIDVEGPLELMDILRIGAQTARALSAAHQQGLVHRDVKPANILLDGGVDRVLLSDFGLARAADDVTLTRSGMIAGTPHFMSPEQASGERVDQRSDLFSLGSVLFAMSTGRPPFRAETALGIARRIDSAEARPIHEINTDLPHWLDEIRIQLMSKSPDDRITSAAKVADLLEQCLAHVQQPEFMKLPEGLNAKSIQRPVVAWSIGVAFCLALLMAVLQRAFLPSLFNPRVIEPPGTVELRARMPVENPEPDSSSLWDDEVNSGIRRFESELSELEWQFAPSNSPANTTRPLETHPRE